MFNNFLDSKKIMEEKITMGNDGVLVVPDRPTIPFIEGDGIGPDIWKASVRVFNAVIEKAYSGKKKIEEEQTVERSKNVKKQIEYKGTFT